MELIVKRAAPDDAAELLAYLKQVGAETDNLTFGGDGLPISVEGERAYLAGLEKSQDGALLVAKVDGKIVGSASLDRLPRRMRHRGELGITVAKAYWNRGIGRQLLREIIALGKENGLERIDLQVRSDNLRAIHLYEAFGFQKYAVYPGFFRIGEELIDFDFMYLVL